MGMLAVLTVRYLRNNFISVLLSVLLDFKCLCVCVSCQGSQSRQWLDLSNQELNDELLQFLLQQRRNRVPFQIHCLRFLDLIFVVCTELMISASYLEMQNEFWTIKVSTDNFS